MGQADKMQDRTDIAAQASASYGSRGVPVDWYVDPADPEAADRYREGAASLEDAATAFLAAHEALAGGEEAPDPADLLDPPISLFPAPAETEERKIWIGLPGFGDSYADEGDLGWQADALCAQTDPEAFFPEKGGSTRDAKKVCAACNVRSQCLEYALSNDERFGIWGGLSERERRRLRKQAV
ncbi:MULTISPECIES: WhiB family transcriptional regulator [Arthrobacter]|uniref:WhiB family transcriptional regulator n=1 Tax=Arthrobacter TaxID=1663 RepID=UPI001E5DC0E5|nr:MULTISPECIES: WhiB family transcriptional regulator [Arthrobacter]MCC9194180.1 WhiB family transcriptional regulator [Arthrobacter sp. zg-Y916]USQ58157.1 WhiB family transcriptional regulator [Arthrobacter caoxuetaonis]